MLSLINESVLVVEVQVLEEDEEAVAVKMVVLEQNIGTLLNSTIRAKVITSGAELPNKRVQRCRQVMEVLISEYESSRRVVGVCKWYRCSFGVDRCMLGVNITGTGAAAVKTVVVGVVGFMDSRLDIPETLDL
ncbi:hypothetical protein C5167_042261 [Papaver somniferum]|uniref:Uncharacterized protein n=1 Tax=Papaver somniferum TaxID=3469 RepID=A0A4Y7L2B8_PAPSO|nr:hypothetical protein C5167_042261 [Papaver somniferum]